MSLIGRVRSMMDAALRDAFDSLEPSIAPENRRLVEALATSLKNRLVREAMVELKRTACAAGNGRAAQEVGVTAVDGGEGA